MKTTEMLRMKTCPPGLRRKKLAIFPVLIAAMLTFAVSASAERAGVGGKRDVDVMTVNLYVGGDIGLIMQVNPADPSYPANLIEAVTTVYYEIVASVPSNRLQTVANQIADRMPDIVAVEEASLIRVQSPGDLIIGGTNAATKVVYDYLKILVADLNAQGAHYKVVSSANEVDVELPMINMQTGSIDDVRLTDREAILARTDLPPGQLRVSHPQSGNFVNVIPIPDLGLFVERGWCSVDVFIRGRDFRCICTHLEEEIAPQIQTLQAQELLAGPANTQLPVILLGDFNADPLRRGYPDYATNYPGPFAYDLLRAAGFGDAWATLNANNPFGGLTWGHDEFLADPTRLFDRRIDFAFYRGKGVVPVQAEVTDMITGLIPSPLWASDHAALSAGFRLK